MKNDFKREVARVATDYCDVNKTRCQFTSKRYGNSGNN